MDDYKFYTELCGNQEVPPVYTRGVGILKIDVKRYKTLKYKLRIYDLTCIYVVHLHLGCDGENGPIVATLFNNCCPTEKTGGLLVEGVLYDRNLRNSSDCNTITKLLNLRKQGKIYVNVKTASFPEGEIRGQL